MAERFFFVETLMTPGKIYGMLKIKILPDNFGNLINQSMLTEISGKFYNYEEKWLFKKQYLNC